MTTGSEANISYRMASSHFDKVDMNLAMELRPFITTAVKNGANVLRVIIYCCTIGGCDKFQKFLTDRLRIENATVYIYHSQMDKEQMNISQEGWDVKGRRCLPRSRL